MNERQQSNAIANRCRHHSIQLSASLRLCANKKMAAPRGSGAAIRWGLVGRLGRQADLFLFDHSGGCVDGHG